MTVAKIEGDLLLNFGHRAEMILLTFTRGLSEGGMANELPPMEDSETCHPVAARFLRVAPPQWALRARIAIPITFVLFVVRVLVV